MQISIFEVKPKKLTQKDKVLNLLKSKATVSMRELNDVCFRYGARLYDLRKDGYIIREKRYSSGEFVYWLED